MISVQQAKQIIGQKAQPLPPKLLALKDTNGLTLAEDVYALMDIPSFVQSSVDGYAIVFDSRNESLIITGESAAGASKLQSIKRGEAARIFTGAPLPEGADTVVMQEYCSVINGSVTIDHQALEPGEHVRPIGAEISSGALAMQKGERITPAAIGFLAGIGVDRIMVYPAPSITLIVTGKEIRQPGSMLAFGQVYDASSVMLGAALQSAGIDKIKVVFADDTLAEVTSALAAALSESDMVLLTGGISVGDYDFVLQATKDCNVQQHFHKIKQKPGKPLYFGTEDNKLVFGLPGNPASSLTCFYEYVLPALDAMQKRPLSIQAAQAVLENNYSKKAGLTHFVKGYTAHGKVQLLHAQESFRLASYARSNCLIVFPETEEKFLSGSNVEIHPL